MERETKFIPAEEKFKQAITERFDLWVSIIDDSSVSPETKAEIKKILSIFRDGAFTSWDTPEDAAYGTISAILTWAEKDNNKGQAMALFKNIKDDIWTFLKEIEK